MIISVTERGTFRRCKRQWDYASFNRQGLTSVVPPTALSFGSLIHKCHEKWLENPNKPITDLVVVAIAEGLKDLKDRYKDIVGVEPHDVELKDYFAQGELALEIMINYEKRWGASLPEGYTLLNAEQTIITPIPGTEHSCPSCEGTGVAPDHIIDAVCSECSGTAIAMHYLEGTLDGLMRDEGGRLWVLERKTYGNRPNVTNLQHNDQFLAYLWSVRQLNMGPIGGIFYDGMWKRRWEKRYTLDDLFLREPLLRSDEEMNQFGLHVRDEALDMAQPDLRVYPNRAWQGCWDCQFERLCSAEDRGEDTAYIRARHYVTRERHEWLEETAD